MPPEYLRKRGHSWYAALAVPKELRETFGTDRLVKALDTRDVAEANRRKHAVIAEWQRQFKETAAGKKPDPSSSPAALLQYAHELRGMVARGELRPFDGEATLSDALEPMREWDLSSDDLTVIQDAHKALRGELLPTLKEQLEVYLEEAGGRLATQTIGEKRRHLTDFVAWIGHRECAAVTRKQAAAYVSGVILKREHSPSTKTKEVSDLRAFFHWLQIQDVVEANPFDKMTAIVRGSTRGKAPARRPWTPAEMLRVLRVVPTDDPLWPLFALGAYTGARREELARLKVEHVTTDGLLIDQGKTAAAVREVPQHDAIRPLVQALVDNAGSDGYLLAGLKVSGPDGQRSWAIGKRAGRTFRLLGITDTRLDLHALRKSFTSAALNAGAPLPVIQQVIGHGPAGVTLNNYTLFNMATCAAAVAGVTYGAEVDSLVRLKGAQVCIVKRGRRMVDWSPESQAA